MDLPIEGRKKVVKAQPVTEQPKEQVIKVTNENAAVIGVRYLQLIYGRLGYIIKLLEKTES